MKEILTLTNITRNINNNKSTSLAETFKRTYVSYKKKLYITL